MSMQFPNGGGQPPVLSDNMPKLSSGLTRGVNKTAVVYIGLVSVAAIGATLWVANNAFSANDHEKKKVTFEEVTVPEKPQLRLPPPEVDQVVARAEPRKLPPMPATAQPATHPRTMTSCSAAWPAKTTWLRLRKRAKRTHCLKTSSLR